MAILAFPEFLLLFTVAACLGAYFLLPFRRLQAIVPGALTLLIALWVYRGDANPLPASWPLAFDLYGRVEQYGFVFQLRPENQAVVAFSLGIVGFTLLLMASTARSTLAPAVLVLLQAMVAGIFLLVTAQIEPLLLIPLLLTVVMAVGITVVQSMEGAQGSLRILLPPFFAFPFFLTVVWYSEQIQLNPQNEELFAASGWLLALGLLLLLAPVPLHGAQPTLSRRVHPLVASLLALLYQLVVLYTLYWVEVRFSFVTQVTPLNLWLTIGGVLTAVWGGVAAAGALHPARLWSYALLHDWGLILLLLSMSGAERWPLVLFLFGLRVISTVTAAVGLAHLYQNLGGLELERLRGSGARYPWSACAFLIGSLGLAGFPLSAGFTGHWSALQTVAVTDWRVAAIVLIASGGVVFGYVRLVRTLFTPSEVQLLPKERLVSVLTAALAIALAVGVALVPQLISPSVVWTLGSFGG